MRGLGAEAYGATPARIGLASSAEASPRMTHGTRTEVHRFHTAPREWAPRLFRSATKNPCKSTADVSTNVPVSAFQRGARRRPRGRT